MGIAMNTSPVNLTRRQHTVPDFYLRQWVNSKGKITCHDILDRRTFSCDPTKALAQSYFYEEDPTKPDNRVETILSKMEGVCSVMFKKLPSPADVAAIANRPRQATAWIRAKLTGADLDNLSQFAAYQYMRVQGAIDQKAYELQPSEIDAELKERALRPGNFSESGYAYVKDRFRAMKLLLLLSPDIEMITSDWPCFHMKGSLDSPLLGEEIGRNPGVVCYLPLSPSIGAIFFSSEFSINARKVPQLVAQVTRGGDAKNQNILVIQKAERFVVASNAEDYIFRIAEKRKKAHPPSQVMMKDADM
jgi:hypothetical protein